MVSYLEHFEIEELKFICWEKYVLRFLNDGRSV